MEENEIKWNLDWDKERKRKLNLKSGIKKLLI